MFGFLTGLLSSKKGMDMASSTLEHVASGLDKLHFSEEERSDAHMKGFDFYLKFMELQSDENSIRSKTRRIGAILIVGNFVMLLNASAFVYVVLDNKDGAKYLLELALTMTTMVTAVTIFYYGYYAVKNVVKSIKTKS